LILKSLCKHMQWNLESSLPFPRRRKFFYDCWVVSSNNQEEQESETTTIIIYQLQFHKKASFGTKEKTFHAKVLSYDSSNKIKNLSVKSMWKNTWVFAPNAMNDNNNCLALTYLVEWPNFFPQNSFNHASS
jgi:hypothetical protein